MDDDVDLRDLDCSVHKGRATTNAVTITRAATVATVIMNVTLNTMKRV